MRTIDKEKTTKVEYLGYQPSKDDDNHVWFVADEYIIESFKAFRRRIDAEKFYASLKVNHPRYLMQIELH